MKHLARINPPPSLVRHRSPDTTVSFVPMESVREWGGLDLDKTKALADIGVGYTYFENGDVIIAKITPCFENGKGALATGLESGIGFGTSELHVIRPSSNIDARLLFYLTISPDFRQRGEAEMYGAGGQKRVPTSYVADFRVPELSLPVQRAIADFLDRKTAAIDELIRKKERLIELLQEKRQALITQAVTKGIDPNVPMKHSGIEWLGEIPAHWDIQRLKHISPQPTVGVVVNPSSYVDPAGDVPFIYGANIRPFQIDTTFARRISASSTLALRKSRLHPGDLLTVRVGEPGMTAVVPPELDGANCASVMIVRRHRSFDSHWLAYAMNSRIGRYQIELVQYGAAQKQFNIAHAVNFVYPVPPIREQHQISEALHTRLSGLSTTHIRAQTQIDRLREYRQSLISAAVTGQLPIPPQAPA